MIAAHKKNSFKFIIQRGGRGERWGILGGQEGW